MNNLRGCGKRKPDALYLESGTSPFGEPVEHFLITPPIDCEKEGIRFSRNYQLVKTPAGIYHLIDWIGENYYPSPWDFIEECRAKGVSRRVEKGFDFSKITIGKSKLIFAHKKVLAPTGSLVSRDKFGASKGLSHKRKIGDLEYKIETQNPHVPTIQSLRAGLFMWAPINYITYVKPADERLLKKLKEKNINITVSEL